MSQDSIPEINVSDVNINVFGIRSWLIQSPIIQDRYAPITLELGFPIVDMPGCVEMHKDNVDKLLPFDKDLVNQDPKGSVTLCPHGEYPSFKALDYEPEQIVETKEAEVPIVTPPLKKENEKSDDKKNDEVSDDSSLNSIGAPNTGNLGLEEEVPCPGPLQLRVGDVTQSGDERVVGHRLLDDGKTCETLYEPTSVVEKYLPPLNQAATVTSLAIVATAGAAATPLLIRVIRPVVKKIWATIQKKLGKEVKRPTLAEVRTNKYREEKGLPPIKKK